MNKDLKLFLIVVAGVALGGVLCVFILKEIVAYNIREAINNARAR